MTLQSQFEALMHQLADVNEMKLDWYIDHVETNPITEQLLSDIARDVLLEQLHSELSSDTVAI